MDGLTFKEWRNNANLSMRAVQDLTNVSIASISRFENGKSIKIPHYQALENLMQGKEPQTEDRQVKIRWHIKQLEILVESEG